MSEAERGCGYRKIGGLYLVSDGGAYINCDGLPLFLEPCDCCGFVPPFSRNLQRIQAAYIIQAEKKIHEEKPVEPGSNPYAYNCECPHSCPICYPEDPFQNQKLQSFGLMYVSSKFYTPGSFIREAEKQGVSKRIPEIPSWMILGETWVFLAHNKYPKGVSLESIKQNGLLMKEPKTAPAIFYGFKPSRIEMPVWKGEISDEEIRILEKKGITPVLLEKTPENIKRHQEAKDRKLIRRLLEPEPEEETEE